MAWLREKKHIFFFRAIFYGHIKSNNLIYLETEKMRIMEREDEHVKW